MHDAELVGLEVEDQGVGNEGLEERDADVEVEQEFQIRPRQPEAHLAVRVQPGQHYTLAAFGVVDLLVFRGTVPVAEVEIFGQTRPAGLLPAIVVSAGQGRGRQAWRAVN